MASSVQSWVPGSLQSSVFGNGSLQSSVFPGAEFELGYIQQSSVLALIPCMGLEKMVRDNKHISAGAKNSLPALAICRNVFPSAGASSGKKGIPCCLPGNS